MLKLCVIYNVNTGEIDGHAGPIDDENESHLAQIQYALSKDPDRRQHLEPWANFVPNKETHIWDAGVIREKTSIEQGDIARSKKIDNILGVKARILALDAFIAEGGAIGTAAQNQRPRYVTHLNRLLADL